MPLWLPGAGWLFVFFSTKAHYHRCQVCVDWNDREMAGSTHSIVFNDDSWGACLRRAWAAYKRGEFGA